MPAFNAETVGCGGVKLDEVNRCYNRVVIRQTTIRMTLEQGGWSPNEVEAAKSADAEGVESRRKQSLGEYAKGVNTSEEDINTIRSEQRGDENIMSGKLNGVQIVAAERITDDDKKEYAATVDGQALSPKDAVDMYFTLYDHAFHRDSVNSRAQWGAVDAIESAHSQYEETIGTLRDKALGKLKNADAA